MKQLQEEIIVLFHAALIGRTDVVQNAISSIRASGKMTDQEIAATISTGRSEDSATPLHIAAHYGHKDVIRSLLNAGADLSFAPAIGEYADCRPYELANDATKEIFHVYMFEQIAMNNYEAICRLMEGGIPVDTKDDSPVGDSTLHWAASFGSLKVASVLITYGCKVNIKNDLNQTPLHLACKGKHLELITLLLDEGGDLEATDQEGHKPSDLLPLGGTSKEIETLISHPPVPSLKLCSIYEKKKEEKAARDQLLHQQRLLQKQLAAAALHTTTPEIDNHGEDHDNDDESLPSQEQHGHEHSRHSHHHDEEEVLRNATAEKDLLIFWPPVKRQQQYPNASPLVLHNNRNLLICVASSDIDMISLLTWSGLMDVMDGFGFQVQIKRSSTGARVRLCIDRNICPVHNSYELKVNSEQIFLTAGDSAGLLYGVYTLIQLLKLHSNVQVDDTGGVLSLTVPCLAITDRPDVAQRGVLWSYRQQSRSASSRMMEQIELMSRLRFNALYLVIDPVSEHPVHTTTIPAHILNNSKIDVNQTEMTSTKVYALDEKCRRHCVDLIPTLVIQSVHQRLPLDVLKNFSHKMISLVIVFDQHSIAEELKSVSCRPSTTTTTAVDTPNDDITAAAITAEVCAACVTACELVIKDAHLAGCTTISLSCSEWTRHTADPVSIAINAGLSATERDFSISFPSSLFSKPLLCVQDYVQNINIYSSKVEAHCSALSVFPAFMDRDFMYPTLLIKYFCFMFGGFAWNRMSLLDMLGDPAAGLDFNSNIVREVMYLLMFPAKVEVPKPAFQTMMDLITGTTFASELGAMQGVGGGAFGPGNALVAVNGSNTYRTDRGGSTGLERSVSDASLSGATGIAETTGSVVVRAELGVSHVLRQDLVKAEKLLWALLTAQDGMSTTAVPTKSEAAVCLRVYKRVLQLAHWKPDSLANKQTTKSGLLSFIAVGTSASFSGDIDDDALERAGVDTTQSIVFEVEELFCTLNMLAALCKAIVLAHKAHEKNRTVGVHSSSSGTHAPAGGGMLSILSCEALFDPVSVGTKSDFANSVLECLSSCSFLWKRRFEASLLASFKAANLLLLKPIEEHSSSSYHPTSTTGSNAASHSRSSTWLIAHTIREANRQYLLQHIPIIPAAAIFRLVTKNIPLPKSVHEFIQRLFTR